MDTEMNEVYNRYRQELAHEDSLINQRLNWHFTAQAFLFAALAISMKESMDAFTKLTILVGLISSVFILVSVVAAICAFVSCRHYLTQIEALKAVRENYPQLNRSEWIIPVGFAAPVGLPVIFIVGWAIAVIGLWP